MNKTIITILGIFICSATMAQSPCDVKLADQTIEKLGPNEQFLKGFIVSSAHNKTVHTTFNLLLNKSINYGFTIGNSTISEQDITLTISNKCETIEEITISPGQFEHIVFNCEVMNVYFISFTSDNPGEVCANAIMTYIEKQE